MSRPLLSERQCRIVLKLLREFGYPSLTFDEVQASAERVAAGTESDTNVIDVIIRNEIDDAL
jgi:hypothetical protein